MASQPDFGLLGSAAQLTNLAPSVQQALLGEQQRQQNSNLLTQQAMQIEQQKKAQALAEQRQQAMNLALNGVIQDPSAHNVGRFMMQFPEMGEQVSKGFDVLSNAQREATLKTAVDVKGYLDGNDIPGARKILLAHIDADKAAGVDTSQYQALVDMLDKNPQAAKALANITIASALGKDKFAEAYGKIGEEARADQKQPYIVRQEAAKASQEETAAAFAPQKAQSDIDTAAAQRERMAAQTANEQADLVLKRQGLELDRDRLTSNIQLELEKLDRAGVQVDAGGRAEINKAVGESVSSTQLADRMDDLANRLSGVNMATGWTSSVRETWKGAFGTQDPVSGLRAEYQTLINQQAVKNLPPGPASDKDIALARQGFPPSNASPAYIQSFLRGMAKMQRAVAASSDRRANWISANGSLAPARRDIDVAGVLIPRGTTFNEFNGNAVQRGKQGQTPSSLQGIIAKYGQ